MMLVPIQISLHLMQIHSQDLQIMVAKYGTPMLPVKKLFVVFIGRLIGDQIKKEFIVYKN